MTFSCQNQARNENESTRFPGCHYFLGAWIQSIGHFCFSRAHV